MNDMSSTIIAKSDQINAADLIGITRTIIIREVRIKDGEEQPVSVLIEGDQKAFRPCKGVRRLMIHVWGADANKYVGQGMTIFQDPSVLWAGKQEGGIRVSHMSGLSEPIEFGMRANRATIKRYRIDPLKLQQTEDFARKWSDQYVAKVGAFGSLADLSAFANEKAAKLAELETARPELHRECVVALDARRNILAIGGSAFQNAPDTEPEGRTDTDMGEAHTGNPEIPAWQAVSQQVWTLIQIAIDKASWQAAETEFLRVSGSLPDSERLSLDSALQAKMRELGGE